jgi:hypothetical protein
LTAPDSEPLHAPTEENLASASPDLLRAMVRTFADALISAKPGALCNAGYGQISEVREERKSTTARAVAHASGTPGPAPSSRPSPSSGPAVTFRPGSSILLRSFPPVRAPPSS